MEQKKIFNNIRKLTAYGILTGLVPEEDKIYTINRLLELFQLQEIDDCEEEENVCVEDLEGILAEMLDYAYEAGLMEENSVVYRDLFDTKIMGMLVARPSEVIRTFRALYAEDPKKATEYYYKFSCDTDYIRRYRIKKDKKVDRFHRIWRSGYYNQSLQAGEGSKGYCSSQECEAVKLSEVSALPRK